MELRERPGSGWTKAVFGLLVTPLVLGGFVSTGWSWGWDHLHRIGGGGVVGFYLLGLILLHPAVQRLATRGFDATGRFLERGQTFNPILVALLGIGLFGSLQIATRIYGDSRYILDDYSPENLSIHIKQLLSFGLLARGRASFALHDLTGRVAGIGFERSYVLVSILCGAVFLFAHARFTATVPGVSRQARTAILWLGLVDGGNQLFFGHVENYTLPRLFSALFLIGVVRSFITPAPTRGRNLPILWFLLAVFFHSQALVLLPTFVLWILFRSSEHPRLALLTRRGTIAAGLGCAVLGLAIIYVATGATCYDYIYSGGRPEPRQIFLPLSTNCVGEPFLRYTLFSGAHFLDLVGSLYSISSGAVLFVIASRICGAWSDRRLAILLCSVALGVLHNFILNPAIGFPFDWDLMCVLSPPLLYTAVFLLARETDPPKRLASMILILGCGTAILFGINADRGAVRQRVEDMGIWLHRTYYGGSHYRLSANLSSIEDPDLEIQERRRVCARIAPQAYPNDREVAFLWERLATRQIEREDWQGALEAYNKALATQPTQWGRLKPVGYLETEVGNLGRGVELLRAYLSRAPNDSEAWLFLGDGAARQSDVRVAREAWSRFLTLTPDGPEADRVRRDLEGLGPPSEAP